MNDPKKAVEQIASEADVTADQPMPPGAVFTRPNKSVTVATRPPPEDLAEIERLAGRLDVPPSSLILGWILSGLNAQRTRPCRAGSRRSPPTSSDSAHSLPDQPRPARTAHPRAPITPRSRASAHTLMPKNGRSATSP